MHVHLKFEDDQELKKVELEMANQDGSHNHNFHFNDSADLSGTEQEYSADIDVPTSAPDVMWLHVTVTDEEGKEASEAFMFHFDN